jgi:hypothetical protein
MARPKIALSESYCFAINNNSGQYDIDFDKLDYRAKLMTSLSHLTNFWGGDFMAFIEPENYSSTG